MEAVQSILSSVMARAAYELGWMHAAARLKELAIQYRSKHPAKFVVLMSGAEALAHTSVVVPRAVKPASGPMRASSVPLARGPEHLAKRLRLASLVANAAEDDVIAADFWEDEDVTPEWMKDDFRYMAGAAVQALAAGQGGTDGTAGTNGTSSTGGGRV